VVAIEHAGQFWSAVPVKVPFERGEGLASYTNLTLLTQRKT